MKNLVQQIDRIQHFLASQIVAPQHSTGDTFTNIAGAQQGITIPINLVEGGDPVVIGRIVGVAAEDALRSTSLVSVYIKGVFNLSVNPIHNKLAVGESVYIDPVSAALSDDYTAIPFGVVLDAVPAGAPKVVRVLLFGATPGAAGFGS